MKFRIAFLRHSPLLALAIAAACGGQSNSEIWVEGAGSAASELPTGSGGTSSTPKPSGSGGSNSNGTGGTAVTGQPGSSGSGNTTSTSGGAPSTGEACDATTFTEAIQITMDVTWAGTSTRQAGTGKIHNWNRFKLNASGNALSGKMRPCGTILPPTQLTALAGGKKVLIELPDSIWDAAEMPEFDLTGTQSGSGAGSTLSLNWISTVGLTMSDPKGPWPKQGSEITDPADVDGDTKPGYSSVPRDGGGYTLPPTSVAAAIGGPWADRVYLASRHIIAINGARTGCEQAAGDAVVESFDSHVVGCRLTGGGAECNASQAKFVDENRMLYTVTGATFRIARVKGDATCADVRNALPL